VSNLVFNVSALQQEIEALAVVASSFLHREDRSRLRDVGRLLSAVVTGESSNRRWSVAESQPIRTIVSEGAYEGRGRRGSDRVYGTVSFVWEVTPHWRTTQRRGTATELAITGNASVVMRIVRCAEIGSQERAMDQEAGADLTVSEADSAVDPSSGDANAGSSDQEIASWRMELGDAASPGCFFHAQVGPYEDRPFPKSVPVPRLPSLFFTPADALQFVIGELFQTDWPAALVRETDALRRLRQYQRARLETLLSWNLSIVTPTPGSKEAGTPWAGLKAAKPDPLLFVASRR